jgi:putative heme-binding domain-containing protein
LRGSPGRINDRDSISLAQYRRGISRNDLHLKDGSQIAGFTAFLSADGVILHTDTGTQRIAESDIASREPGKVSLMPGGLLTGLTAAEFADLLAYMKTCGK